MATQGSNLTLGGALVTTGLLGGLYYGFSVAVMPGLRATDDATFVATMQSINDAIVNPAFMVVFLGAPTLTAAAAWQWRERPGVRRLLFAALALHLAGLGMTAGANVPLNEALDRAGDPAKLAPNQLAEARAAYQEPWTRRHLLRTGLTVGALSCLAAAGLVAGRRPAGKRSAEAAEGRGIAAPGADARPFSRARDASAR
ncbi:MAG: DUF1772 domain-containing protein [Solirubrobacteraceae bacterium]|nr:DUF1772 domain-containing protein [Solirubrobacteraceae bacterium]